MNKKQFREGGIISRIIPKIKTSLPGLEGKEIFESNPQFVNEGYSGGKMKLLKKVYWVNGWPNNGIGRLLLKFPYTQTSLVLTNNGKIIVCEMTQDLKSAIESKKSWMEYCRQHGGVREGFDLTDEIKTMQNYLND